MTKRKNRGGHNGHRQNDTWDSWEEDVGKFAVPLTNPVVSDANSIPIGSRRQATLTVPRSTPPAPSSTTAAQPTLEEIIQAKIDKITSGIYDTSSDTTKPSSPAASTVASKEKQDEEDQDEKTQDEDVEMAPAVGWPDEFYDKYVGPHPSYIEVAKPFVSQQKIQDMMLHVGLVEAKEENTFRLPGVAWIDQVRKALFLPVRTFNTAVIFYHKFRLTYGEIPDYNYADVAAGALFAACKIEDTLKKSREVLCAAYNMKVPLSEHISPDDSILDHHSKNVQGLERLMLEATGFDFRSRHPQKWVAKLAKYLRLDLTTTGRMAYYMSVDIFRTLAPLKQAPSTLALACVELSMRIHELPLNRITGEHGINLKKWGTTRAEVMETIMDLLDLYTGHKSDTIIGREIPMETFISIRIPLNQEVTASKLPRYTNSEKKPVDKGATTNGTKALNGTKDANLNAVLANSAVSASPNGMAMAGKRGMEGTVRFMLDPVQAKDEKDEVLKYFIIEEEEYEVEVEVERPIKREPATSSRAGRVDLR